MKLAVPLRSLSGGEAPRGKTLNYKHIKYISKMKKSIFGFVALAIAFAFGTMMSCSEKEEQVPAMSVEEVNAVLATDSLLDSTIVVEGTVEHICECNGMKMKLAGAEFCCSWDSVFPAELMGQVVRVEGILREVRTTAEDVDKMEQELIAKLAADSAAQAAGQEPAQCEKKACDKKEGCCPDKQEGDSACCPMAEIAELRRQIAERDSIEGKAYLSKYCIEVVKCAPVVAEEAAE